MSYVVMYLNVFFRDVSLNTRFVFLRKKKCSSVVLYTANKRKLLISRQTRSFIYYFNVKTFVSVKKLKDDSHFESLALCSAKFIMEPSRQDKFINRLSQSCSHGFLVWCGRTRHVTNFRSLARDSRSLSRYALKSSTCEQVQFIK